VIRTAATGLRRGWMAPIIRNLPTQSARRFNPRRGGQPIHVDDAVLTLRRACATFSINRSSGDVRKTAEMGEGIPAAQAQLCQRGLPREGELGVQRPVTLVGRGRRHRCPPWEHQVRAPRSEYHDGNHDTPLEAPRSDFGHEFAHDVRPSIRAPRTGCCPGAQGIGSRRPRIVSRGRSRSRAQLPPRTAAEMGHPGRRPRRWYPANLARAR
jgi:hypothetical protein